MLVGKTVTKSRHEAPHQLVEVSRRKLLRSATVIVSGAIVLAGATTATHAEADPAKSSQKAAAYQTSPKNGQRCVDCALFQAPSSCQVVDGTISRAGWCNLFAAKS
jgi:hypothetical protein